jgi:hypothetical protein
MNASTIDFSFRISKNFAAWAELPHFQLASLHLLSFTPCPSSVVKEHTNLNLATGIMDFPRCLLRTLRGEHGDSAGGTPVDADLAGFAALGVNDSVEAAFVEPTDAEQMDPDTISTLEDLSVLLQKTLLASLLSEDTSLEPWTDEEAEQRTKDTLVRARDSQTLEDEDNTEMKNLGELLRACKNTLRWYLQFYLAAKEPVLPPPLRRLESNNMIELYLLIIERTAGEPENDARQQVARQACLSLFYSTYSPSGNDESIKRAQAYLVENLGFVSVLLRLLLIYNNPVVLVSLIRIIHNLLASLPGTIKRVEEARIQCIDSKAPWTARFDGTEVNLQNILTSILMWSLQATPAFPGDATDRRADLVLEILRVLYILRAGRHILDNETMAQLMAYFLMLPNGLDRAYSSKLAAISLLMDTPAEYSEQLVEQKRVLPLLAVLDSQVSQVVDSSEVGNAAAAALVPILSVLNKFSIHSQAFRNKVKKHVFPPEAEEHFSFLRAEAELKPKRNMNPLDAPNDTIRGKLIKLMTWTEGHVKRTASELLWTICDENEKEFISRVGMGNALPLLSSKGLFHLPKELYS